MMTRSNCLWLAVLVLMPVSAAMSADLSPSRAALDSAAREGTAIAARHAGYPFGAYVVYEVRDARDIDPADGAVDAVVLATPIERTRHAAYLAAYAGGHSDGTEAFTQSGLTNGAIAVMVFAHGTDEDDHGFAAKFGPARITFGEGALIEAVPVPSETSEATYSLAKVERDRQVATVTYTFDLKTVAKAGARTARLHFADSTSKVFDVVIDLAKVQ